MEQSNEQKLVDLCFQLAIAVYLQRDYFEKHENNYKQEVIANWVAQELREYGFPTLPRGASWGVLLDDAGYMKI